MTNPLQAKQAITFDDVLLEPRYSEVIPSDVDVSTRLTKRIELQVPLLSAPMDTVTEHAMAISLAQQGGIGVIHKNLSIERQTTEVDLVKRSANGIIDDPVTLPPTATVAAAREMMEKTQCKRRAYRPGRWPSRGHFDSARPAISRIRRLARC